VPPLQFRPTEGSPLLICKLTEITGAFAGGEEFSSGRASIAKPLTLIVDKEKQLVPD